MARGMGWVGKALAAVALALALGACGAAKSSSGPVDSTPPPPPPPPADPGFQFGTKGPWPVANVVYDSKDGIKEGPVVGVTSDEAQNRWVATHVALYLLRPGDATFTRFDESDGLHMGSNAAHYCNDREIGKDDPCTSTESWGVANPPGITALVGGGKDEVFVGYFGRHPWTYDCDKDGNGVDNCDPDRHSGKIDRVKLNKNGTLEVTRFDLVANNHGGNYWHDRWIQRLVFDHFVHKHTLYAGTEHGVTILFPDRWRAPRPDEWYDTANQEWMGDHLHARVCFEKECDPNSSANQRMGDWHGLAIDANGDLWHAGKWSAGLITFDPTPLNWFGRNGFAFKYAFGDPWDGSSGSMPVFPVANEGHDVNLSAVTVCPDGKVWFASYNPADGVEQTIASFEPGKFTHYTSGALGLGERWVQDLVCLPDGRLVLAGSSTGLSIWDPATNISTRIRAGDGIPSDEVLALEVDRMTDPPALHVATAGGAAILRVLP